MDKIAKKIFIVLMTSSLLLTSSISSAKQVEIGIGAIAIDASVIGKGKFVVNDTIDEGDSLKTGDKGSTTILFNDESMLTLGPRSHAHIEVYKTGKEGKPGHSVIRVHKGQFRYFPGEILEKGGSQFIAVGEKFLGKVGIATNSSIFFNNLTPQNSNNNNTENTNNQESLADSTETGTVDNPDDITITGENNLTEQDLPNNDLDQDTNDNNGVGNQTGNIQVANTGSLSTGNEGGTGGVIFKEHKDDPFSQGQLNNQNSVLAGDNTPAPTTPNSNDDTSQSGSIAALKGITAFSEYGLSGTVKNDKGNFNGDVDVFSKKGIQIGFISSKNKNTATSLVSNTNPNKTLSILTPQTFEAAPTYEVPIYTAPTLEAATPVVTAPTTVVGRTRRID